MEAHEIVQILDISLIEVAGERWDSLNRVIRPPFQLKNAFLGEYKSLPDILSTTLSKEFVEATLLILKKRIAVLGWQISNIHVITPALYMHKIYMEKG